MEIMIDTKNKEEVAVLEMHGVQPLEVFGFVWIDLNAVGLR